MNANDQPSRLTTDFMAGVLSGYLMGNQAGYQQAQDDMDAHWAQLAHTIRAHAGTYPHSVHEQAVRARRRAAAARNQAQAGPWDPEPDP